MHQKISTGGFVEVLVVLAGLTGLTALGIIKVAPTLQSTQPHAVHTAVAPTDTPIPSVIQTIQPDAIQTEEVTGVGLTSNGQMRVLMNGEEHTYSLLGIQPVASDSAECTQTDLNAIEQNITGQSLYLVRYNNEDEDDRYVFLKNLTLLNKNLLSKGLAKINDKNHPYYDEFREEQINAEKNKLGIWSNECSITPTPTEELLTQLIVSPSPTPTRIPTNTPSPSPTKIYTSTQKPQIKGESTQISPTITPTITLKEYIPASPTATVTKPLNADFVFELINLHRKTKNLPAFEKEGELCKLAESRATEIDNEIFGTSSVHAGFIARNIPYWITENVAGYGSESANVNWWLGSTIHRNAIEGNSKYSCGACTSRSCVQLFTSYVPK